MIKKSILAAGILVSSSLFAANEESFEVCVPDGLCALRVTDTDTQEPVWLVTRSSVDLQLIWEAGNFWLVSDQDYADVKALVREQIVLPAVNPDTSVSLAEKKGGGSTPAPSSSSSGGSGSSGGGGGLITVGNITIGGGGGSSCGDCHKGNMREIHKKVLQ
jgi:hypothetical protein